MTRRELRAVSFDLKWTSEPVFADFGPHMDLTLTHEFLEVHVLSRAWSTRLF
jgi:hypothetical protein